MIPGGGTFVRLASDQNPQRRELISLLNCASYPTNGPGLLNGMYRNRCLELVKWNLSLTYFLLTFDARTK
jgi:hypothetical protein